MLCGINGFYRKMGSQSSFVIMFYFKSNKKKCVNFFVICPLKPLSHRAWDFSVTEKMAITERFNKGHSKVADENRSQPVF